MRPAKAWAATLLLAAGAAWAGGEERYGRLPLAFEPNRGQADPQVEFIARGAGYQLSLTPTEAEYRLQREGQAAVVRMELLGANAQASARGVHPLEGQSHYLASRDPARWITHVPHFARVELPQVYRGIDLAYYGNGTQLEYDFTLAPRAEPRRIAIAVHGARRLEIDRDGQLLAHTPSGVVAWRKPVAYQEVAGARRAVRVAYALRGANRFGFRVGDYDRRETLVIDPVLAYSTLLGSAAADHANAIAVDASGSAVIVGQAGSGSFPSTGGTFPASGGVFVAKLNPAGSALEYSTFLGPGRGAGVALQGGNVYVTGTGPDTFPVTAGAVDDALPGDNAFVAKLTPDGSALVYSALIGGGLTQGAAIAVDAAGNAYVTGTTQSPTFPASAGAFQPTRPTLGQVFLGDIDAFFFKLDAAGSALAYSTYLGSTENDFGESIALDTAGRAYIAGTTTGRSAAWNGNPAAALPFPTTSTAFQSSFVGGASAFVAKFDPAAPGAASVVYSTLLDGPNETSQGHGVAVDGAGSAYVTGSGGPGFPVTAGAYGAAASVGGAFVAKLDATGSGLAYSAMIRGGDGREIALDSARNVFVAGLADAAELALVNPLAEFGGGSLFAAKLDATGATAAYSTLIGGHLDVRMGLAVDSFGAAYMTGSALNAFFTTPGAYQGAIAGVTDAFVLKIVTDQPPTANAGTNQNVIAGVPFTLDASGSIDPEGAALTYVWRDSTNAIVGTSDLVTLTLSQQGIHVFTLTVSDGVHSATASVQVTVEAVLAINLFGNASGRVTTCDGTPSCDLTIDCVTGNEPACAARFAAPTGVTLRAITAPGVVFTGWRPPCAGTGSCTVTVSSNLVVGAQFDVQQVTLSVANGGNGRVTSTPAGIDCPGACAMVVDYNTPVTLSAAPDAGYLFGGWSGACGGMSACSITLDGAKSITAAFVRIGLTSLAVAPASATLPVGGRRQFTATATFSDGSARRLTDRSVEASDNDTCAIARDGVVKCLGRFPTPTRVPAFDNAIALAGATFHMCALFADGSVNCEGVPVPLAGPALAIASQSVVSCALLSTGSVQCWDGRSPAPAPVNVSGITNAIAIGAEAGDGTCVVLSDGTVSCWGGLGDGSDPLRAPAPVAGVINAVAVTYGVKHGCALIADGTVMCWGDNDHGQLGNGRIVLPTGQPEPPTWVQDSAGVLTGAIGIVSGDYHACALLANGIVKCWGLAAALNVPGDSPLAIAFFQGPPPGMSAIPPAIGVAAGAYLTCVTLANGDVWCEGLAQGGPILPPTLVAGLDDVLGPSWSSADPAVASVMTNGVAVGQGVGSTAVIAVEGSRSASTALTVAAGANVATRAVTADPAAPAVTVSFAAITQAGITTVAPAGTCPAAPSGFRLGNPPTCLELASTATFVPPATVCVAYDPAAFTGPPQLFHFESGAWTDVTSSVDTVNHVVCGAVSSFSPFTLMERDTVGRLFADAGPDQEIECTSPAGASVTLDGSRSSRGPGIAYRWKGRFGTIEAMIANVTLPLGNDVSHLEVSAGRAHAVDTVKVRVRDTQPPVISAAGATPSILPPGLGRVPVTVELSAADLCDASLRCRIEKVRVSGGASSSDWEITGPLTVRLARGGRGKARTYSIDVACTDDSGNTARTTVQVTAPGQ